MSASHTRVAFAPQEGVFARVYAHAGMVSYQGQKMSKSLGNLVFVSRLVADGVDPMAIRMALLAHHYRSDWEWTDAVLGAGAGSAGPLARRARPRQRLAGSPRTPSATAHPSAPPPLAAELVLAGVRTRMHDDLDAPGALEVVGRWADAVLAEAPMRSPRTTWPVPGSSGTPSTPCSGSACSAGTDPFPTVPGWWPCF